LNQLVKSFGIDKYLYLKETHSTNEHATNLSSINTPNLNFCVYTYNQTDGKGQIGRKWYTGADENLAVSYVINEVNLKVKNHFYLNMTISLALLRLVSSIVPLKVCSIKWPNDIYLGNKKVAGILIQNQIKGNIISKSIIGIGLNVNTKDFPVEIPNPISMLSASENKKPFQLYELLEKLTIELTQGLSTIDFFNEKLRREYTQKLFRLNELNYFKTNDKTFEGKILGISEDGQLKMDTQEGIKTFSFREVSYENLI